MRQRRPTCGYIYREMTLQDVAAELGCTAERVRQIETKALYKIRAALAARGFTSDMVLPPNYDEARA